MYIGLFVILLSIIFDISTIKLEKVNLFFMFLKNLILFIICHLIIHTNIVVLYAVSIYFALTSIYVIDRIYRY